MEEDVCHRGALLALMPGHEVRICDLRIKGPEGALSSACTSSYIAMEATGGEDRRGARGREEEEEVGEVEEAEEEGSTPVMVWVSM